MKARRQHAEATPQRRRDLEAFLEASRAANRPNDLGRSLQAILDAALRLLEADEGSIMLMEDAAGGMRIAAARGIPSDIRRGVLVHPGEGIAGAVLQSGKPMLLPAPLDVSRFQGYVEKTRQIHSALSVPLRARERVLGVLNLNLMRPGASFDEEDLQVAFLFAEHAALAIQSADMLGRTERTARELETLRGATTRLSRSLRLDSVAETTLTEALAICGSSTGLLTLAGQGRVELARYRGLSRDGVREVLRSPGFTAWLAAAEPTTIRRPATDPTFAPLAAELGPSPLAVAPL
ncbi:MAG: GAF domain-containing protein, partial [Actinomycetota bacterium]